MQTGRYITISLLTTDCYSDQLESSHGYTGKGTALYPNSDKYVGDFKDGVSTSNRFRCVLKPFV